MNKSNFKSVWVLSSLSFLIFLVLYVIDHYGKTLFGINLRTANDTIAFSIRLLPALIAVWILSLIAMIIYICKIIKKLKKKETITKMNWVSITMAVPGIWLVIIFINRIVIGIIKHNQTIN